MLSGRWTLLLCALLGSALAFGPVAAVPGAAPADSHAAVLDAEQLSDQLEAGQSTEGLEQGQPDDRLIPNTQEEIDPDATITRITVAENGTATWSLTIRMRLDTNESVEGFEAFQQEFEANRSVYLGRYQDRMTGVVENAAAVTGREMTATEFEAETGIQEVPRRWGYVTYRFRWEGFVSPGEDSVTVGDVFSGGLFLEEGDILIIEGPADYEVSDTDPSPDETEGNQLQWNGPLSFDDQRPQVQFTAQGAPDSEPAPDSSDGGDSGLPLLVGVLIVALVGIGAVAVRWLGTQRDDGDSAAAAEQAQPAGDGQAAAAAQQTAAAGAGAETEEDEGTLNLGELATDEDRVEALLADEDGRMRQADIAERLDWSASKTSRVISEMADEGDVEKLRIGRENVIDLLEGDEGEEPAGK